MTSHTPIVFPERLNFSTWLLDKHLEAGTGERPCLYFHDQLLSYRDVYQLTGRVGNFLLGLGLEPLDRVAILLPDCPEWVATFLATVRIGGIAVTVNTLLTPENHAFILNDCLAKILFIHEDFLDEHDRIAGQLESVERVVVVGKPRLGQLAFDQLAEAASPELPPARTHKDDLAYMFYTSGTTGQPKGVVHTQHDIPFCCRSYGEDVLALRPEDKCFSISKLFFTYGLGNSLYFPMYFGSSIVLDDRSPTPARALSTVAEHGVSVFFAVPTFYKATLEYKRQRDSGSNEFAGVRYCVSAGEALPAATYHEWLEMFGVEIVDGIGNSELSNLYISNRPGQVIPGSSGTLVHGFEVKIVDEHGHECPPGEVGELWVCGDSGMAFYWRRHEETKNAMIGPWIRTGDKYSVDEKGNYWYAGRTDDMFKVGGQWVSPFEVENVVLKHDAVLECAVVGKPDEEGYVHTVCYVVPREGVEPSDRLVLDLKSFVRNEIESYKRPRTVRFVGELPKTPTGKIQRFRLRAMLAEEPDSELGAQGGEEKTVEMAAVDKQGLVERSS